MTDELKAAYADGFRDGSIDGHKEGVKVGISRALMVFQANMRALEISAYGEAQEPARSVVAEIVALFPQTGHLR